MGAAATKAVGNVYYEARKKAAMYNDRLSSRDGAAERPHEQGVPRRLQRHPQMGGRKVSKEDPAAIQKKQVGGSKFSIPEVEF